MWPILVADHQFSYPIVAHSLAIFPSYTMKIHMQVYPIDGLDSSGLSLARLGLGISNGRMNSLYPTHSHADLKRSRFR